MIRASHRPLGGSVAVSALLLSLTLTSSALAGSTYPPGPSGCCPDTLTIVNLRNPAAVPHPVAGDVVLGIRGIITAFAPHFGPYGFYMQMPSGLPYSGVAVFTGNVDHGPGTPYNLQVGDEVAVYGKVQHFSDTDPGGSTENIVIGSVDGGTTMAVPEGVSPAQGDVFVRVVSHGNPLPPFHVGTLAELDQSQDNPAGEPWLGMLVQLPGPLEVQSAAAGATGASQLTSANTFLVSDPACVSACDAALVDGGYLAD